MTRPYGTAPVTLADGRMAYERQGCPFDDRLARTPYLVLPKLAIQAMPMEWRLRFDAMLAEMETAGIETPEYFVFRAGHDQYTRARMVNEETRFVRIVRGEEDPWGNYKYGDVAELCPKFRERQQ